MFNIWHKIYQGIQQSFRQFILPAVCIRCEQSLQSYGLCVTCFSTLSPIEKPRCRRCGYPFQNRTQGSICGRCMQSAPIFTCRSAYVYNDTSRDIILSLKYGDNTRAVPHMAQAILQCINKEMRLNTDIIIPVPLHNRRLWSRKYNQSALIAQAMSRKLQKPLITTAVKRIHFKSPQGGKSVAARYRNVQSAFKVINPKHINGKTVLLVDDVYTSGATLNAVSKQLLKAGAITVYATTYARVC